MSDKRLYEDHPYNAKKSQKLRSTQRTGARNSTKLGKGFCSTTKQLSECFPNVHKNFRTDVYLSNKSKTHLEMESTYIVQQLENIMPNKQSPENSRDPPAGICFLTYQR